MRPIHEQVVDVRSGLQPQGSMIGIITSDPAAQYIRSPSFSTKTGDWMVVLAGPGQLVSAVEFPANSEKYREFSILCPIAGRSRRRVPRWQVWNAWSCPHDVIPAVALGARARQSSSRTGVLRAPDFGEIRLEEAGRGDCCRGA